VTVADVRRPLLCVLAGLTLLAGCSSGDPEHRPGVVPASRADVPERCPGPRLPAHGGRADRHPLGPHPTAGASAGQLQLAHQVTCGDLTTAADGVSSGP
jgi:hypothetical protein